MKGQCLQPIVTDFFVPYTLAGAFQYLSLTFYHHLLLCGRKYCAAQRWWLFRSDPLQATVLQVCFSTGFYFMMGKYVEIFHSSPVHVVAFQYVQCPKSES